MPTRDQIRAMTAYRNVGRVPQALQKDYKIIVHDFGATVLKSGLAAAMSLLERQKDRDATKEFLKHLAGSNIPGLPQQPDQLAERIRSLQLERYMLATREILKVTLWHKRAVQALFGDE